jgi:hypothetical protein
MHPTCIQGAGNHNTIIQSDRNLPPVEWHKALKGSWLLSKIRAGRRLPNQVANYKDRRRIYISHFDSVR